jgi:hypothetical protein
LAEGDCGSYVAEVEIAKHDMRVVTVLCVLAGMTLDGPFAEFSYSIAVVSLDDSFEPLETQDRNIAAGYIPADVRPMIMDVVCSCLRLLVEKVRPNGVYRVVKEPNPPEKALKKHHMLTMALKDLGYFVDEEGTDPYSRRFSVMRRCSD